MSPSASVPSIAFTQDAPVPSETHGAKSWPATHSTQPSLLRRFLKAESSDLWTVLIYSVVIGLIYLAVPVATQAVVNTVAFGTVLQPLVVLTVAVLVALAASGALQILRTWIVEVIQQRLFARITSAVASRLLNADVHALATHRGPELVNRFLEVATLQKATSMLLIDGLATASQILFAAILLGLYHPWLLVLDVVLLLLIAIAILPFLQRGVATSIEESKVKYDLVAWFEEMASHPELFRATGRSAYGLGRTNSLLNAYIQRRRVHFRVLLTHITGFVTIHALCSAALLGVGGWLVINRQLTLGQLIAAELVINLMLNALTKFGKQLETYYDLEAAMDKLSHLIDLPRERDGHLDALSGGPGLSLNLRNVVLFDGENNLEVGPVSLELPGGARYGVRASDGPPSSLLLDLLAGRATPLSGTVEVDGSDIRHISRARLRSEVALIRGMELFHGSVLENLTFGSESVTADQVREMLQKLDLWTAISRLPHGLQTTVNTPFDPGNLSLTRGQALRLMLARALLHQPRLLLIDLSQPERTLTTTLRDLLAEKRLRCTVVICTDNPELLAQCDRTITLASPLTNSEVYL